MHTYIPHYKDIKGSGSIAPHIFNLGIEMRGHLHIPAALPLGKEPQHSLDRLCGLRELKCKLSRVGLLEVEEYISV
jgi:hypothetical protein